MQAIKPIPLTDALERDGYVLISTEHDGSTFLRLAESLGEVIDDTAVVLRDFKTSRPRSYLSSPGRVPLHTDHPDARLVVWWCERQDEHMGHSLLLDTHKLLQKLTDAEVQALHNLMLPCPDRKGMTPSHLEPILQTQGEHHRFYFAPWHAKRVLNEGQLSHPERRLLVRIVEQIHEIQDTGELHSCRLMPGQVLIVDNHRVLHGRESISDTSARKLRRLWIA